MCLSVSISKYTQSPKYWRVGAMPTSPLQYNLHHSADFDKSETVTRADVGIGPDGGGLFGCFAE